MITYDNSTDLSSPASSGGQTDFPILREHWPNFAQAAAHDAPGKCWVHRAVLTIQKFGRRSLSTAENIDACQRRMIERKLPRDIKVAS